MIKDIYLCIDKQSYKYALSHYANKHTKVRYCHFHKNTKRISRYILGGAKKNIYVMKKYDSGYLKFDFGNTQQIILIFLPDITYRLKLTEVVYRISR